MKGVRWRFAVSSAQSSTLFSCEALINVQLTCPIDETVSFPTFGRLRADRRWGLRATRVLELSGSTLRQITPVSLASAMPRDFGRPRPLKAGHLQDIDRSIRYQSSSSGTRSEKGSYFRWLVQVAADTSLHPSSQPAEPPGRASPISERSTAARPPSLDWRSTPRAYFPQGVPGWDRNAPTQQRRRSPGPDQREWRHGATPRAPDPRGNR